MELRDRKSFELLPLSVVVPVFNEQASLDELVSRCLKACDSLDLKYELILVDDGGSELLS